MSFPAHSSPHGSILLRQSEGYMSWIATRADPKLQQKLTLLTCGLVGLIGLADFWLETNISLEVFYFIPVALAVFARGRTFGIWVSVASVIIWAGGDLAAGARFTSWVVPTWNAVITLISYSVLVWLLSNLVELQHDLERRVAQRTAALASEIAERKRLEQSVLEISERERRSIGHDLHDGLGQHLTGTAITAQLLAETLQDRTAPEAAEARKIVGLIKTGIGQTRAMAKGLLLAEIDPEGLPSALTEFCHLTSEQFRVRCNFSNETPAMPPLLGAANHLFRIAQEAVRNAVRHGRATQIDVQINTSKYGLTLLVVDNGSGLPPPAERGVGLGLQIMAHRATMIGASLTIERGPEDGTIVRCTLPLSTHD